jgi:hypothetical protein
VNQSAQEDFTKLKKEIQSHEGLLSIIKKEKMPRKKEMARLALNELEKSQGKLLESYVKIHFNELLKRLILLEHELYREYERTLIANSLKVFLNERFGKTTEFPELQKLFDGISKLDQSKFTDFMGETTIKLYPVMSLIAMSASQGAKSRAGSSLENHLENLFRVLNFKFEPQKLIQGVRVDFIFPNLEMFQKQAGDCLFLASQSTLKDRFRMAISQISSISNVRKYIVTATGLGIITPRDVHDLTDNKLHEIRDKGFKIIVFDEVKEKYRDNPTVLSYSDFIGKEYPAISKLWD